MKDTCEVKLSFALTKALKSLTRRVGGSAGLGLHKMEGRRDKSRIKKQRGKDIVGTSKFGYATNSQIGAVPLSQKGGL
jgi:hypothetical protein